MKNVLVIFISELVIALIATFAFQAGTFDRYFFAIFGLCNLVIGLLSFFIGLIIYFVNAETGKPWFLASGLILLIGGFTCSIFAFE